MPDLGYLPGKQDSCDLPEHIACALWVPTANYPDSNLTVPTQVSFLTSLGLYLHVHKT